MKKIVLALLLGFFCSAASAAWTPWFVNGAGDKIFLDKATAKSVDGVVSVWQRSDLIAPFTIGNLTTYSILTYTEIDCKGGRWRQIKLKSYYAPNLGGEPSSEIDGLKVWLPSPAGSAAGKSFAVLCSVKQ